MGPKAPSNLQAGDKGNSARAGTRWRNSNQTPGTSRALGRSRARSRAGRGGTKVPGRRGVAGNALDPPPQQATPLESQVTRQADPRPRAWGAGAGRGARASRPLRPRPPRCARAAAPRPSSPGVGGAREPSRGSRGSAGLGGAREPPPPPRHGPARPPGPSPR